jgi:ATP synthase F1 gamma subunit
MKTISVIKKDMEFNRGLSSLIDVLKNIAVSQYRALEQKLKGYEKLTSTIESFFNLVDVSLIRHPFVSGGDKPLAVVAVTSDSGLLGGLNMEVVSTAVSELQEKAGTLIVIGERGKMYAQESGMPFVSFSGIRDEERYGQAMQLRDYCADVVFKGSFGALKVVYPRPISFTVQKVETETFLPFVPPAPEQEQKIIPVDKDVILESNLGDIIEYLVFIWMGQRFYEIFGLSRLAEFAARYVHLEESLQKLKEMDNKLKLQYFRVRHEMIDRNMRELFSARILYANK